MTDPPAIVPSGAQPLPIWVETAEDANAQRLRLLGDAKLAREQASTSTMAVAGIVQDAIHAEGSDPMGIANAFVELLHDYAALCGDHHRLVERAKADEDTVAIANELVDVAQRFGAVDGRAGAMLEDLQAESE